ncbi:MAG: addiction module protein [Chloroflexi bacterium]|nr:addiction module protein [Chloroflexota bacterium]
MSAAEIIEQIRGLPAEERRDLAELIWVQFGDFDNDLTPEQAAELDRRLEEYRQNPNDGSPWEEVKARLEAQLRRKP